MAKKGKMIVLANATAGKDAEFNTWYNTIHAKEVVGLEGFTSVKRYKVDMQMLPQANPPEFGYIMVYDMSDVDTANAKMAEFAPKSTQSDSLDFTRTTSVQAEEIFTYKK